VVVFLFFCGLQVDCKVERYAFNIVENGTRVNEEVEVDVEEQTEVFRVPKHNNVDALELLNDFNSGISARRDPNNKVCHVSKLDPSLPSPGKLKVDMDQASRQSLPDEVITKRSVVTVVGVADRLALPKKILRFCGTFPIYEVEIDEIPSDGLNTTLRQDSGRVRGKRHHFGNVYKLCSYGEALKLDRCLAKVGHMNVQRACKTDRVVCFYIATCQHRGSSVNSNNYNCMIQVYHHYNYYGYCCTVSCPLNSYSNPGYNNPDDPDDNNPWGEV